MKCCKIFYDMHVSMTKQSGDFQKLIFTKTITQQYRYRLFSLHLKKNFHRQLEDVQRL